MSGLKVIGMGIAVAFLVSGCGDKGSSGSAASGSGESISFVTTQDGSALKIDPKLFDTPAAKAFLSSGKNDYIGKQEAIAKGKKVYQMYSCSQCHGPSAGGQVGPSLIGPNYRYAKDVTDKGMFETIWNGTNGGMGAKGKGVMVAGDPNSGLSPDEILQVIAWVRSLSSK